MTEYVPPEDRTQVRDEPDYARLADPRPSSERDALKLLTEGMAADWSLEGLTTLLYGIPKLQLGLPITAPPTAELKALQRAWFILLLPVADREGHRPAAADAAAGPRPGPDPYLLGG